MFFKRIFKNEDLGSLTTLEIAEYVEVFLFRNIKVPPKTFRLMGQDGYIHYNDGLAVVSLFESNKRTGRLLKNLSRVLEDKGHTVEIYSDYYHTSILKANALSVIRDDSKYNKLKEWKRLWLSLF